MPNPFRFAVQSFSADSLTEWQERARRVEALGYSALHVADHIIGPGPALERSNHPIQSLAAVPAMCFAAAATSTLKIGARVFCVDYRLPVVLAKEMMTLDMLSGGRASKLLTGSADEIEAVTEVDEALENQLGSEKSFLARSAAAIELELAVDRNPYLDDLIDNFSEMAAKAREDESSS